MELTADDVYRMLDRVLPVTAALPATALSGGERMILAGYLFAEGEELTAAVARALRDRGGLFADLPIAGEDLEARLRLARALRSLHASLQVICRRADDEAMRVQARVVKDALDVVQHVRSGKGSPFAGALQAARADALQTAEDVLKLRKRQRRDVQRRSGRVARRIAARIQPPAPAAPLDQALLPEEEIEPAAEQATPPPSTSPSPQKRAVQEARRQLRKRALTRGR